jgi:hypothetical protein
MAEQLYPPINGVQSPMPPKFIVQTPTGTFTQFDSAGINCVGVNIQNPAYDDSGNPVTAYLYVQAGGVAGAEIAPGETKFIACSNTNQLKLGIISGAGGTVAFARIEVIRVNGVS